MIDFLCSLIGCLPIDCLQLRFMQQAMLGILLLAPMTAMLGVQILHFRMAFYADAIGHSAFAGAGLGLILSLDPHFAMPVFAVLVGLSIIALKRRSHLSSDTAIGVVFSAVVAFGLAVVSKSPGVARNMQQFLFGDVLTISTGDITFLLFLLPCIFLFQTFGFNSLLCIALNPIMARANGIHTGIWQYLFATILAIIVIFSVWAVGVLLVTALLIVPAATARNIAKSSRGMFWWAIVLSILSSALGLILSAQPWLGTASGSSIILVSCSFFALSTIPGILQRERKA